MVEEEDPYLSAMAAMRARHELGQLQVAWASTSSRRRQDSAPSAASGEDRVQEVSRMPTCVTDLDEMVSEDIEVDPTMLGVLQHARLNSVSVEMGQTLFLTPTVTMH